MAEVRGAGQPILCLPGFGMDRSVMIEAMEPALADRPGWRRIYVDLPGSGQSPAGPENSDGVADAVAEFIDRETGPGRLLLAGCSYGGYIATGLARRMPDRTAGLLLVCSGVKIKPEDRDLPAAGDPADADDWLADVPADLRTHLSTALGNRTREVARRIATLLSSAAPGDAEYLRRLRAEGYQLSDEDSPAVFSAPTCIIAGRQDRVAGYADQFRALQSYPEASFHALTGAGHYVPFEQPEVFRSLVQDWLARCEGSAAGSTR